MNRIIGIDVARALAVFGMIIVNFKVVFGEQGNSSLRYFAHIFDGKAAATFVVLAGIGLALMTNTAIQQKDFTKLKKAKFRIIKRAIFLFIIGISYIPIWPADILHFYGVYMLLALFFIAAKPNYLLLAAGIFILLFPLLNLFFNYETGWDFENLSYIDFWTFQGFFRNLFFNGFHPLIPWVSFMLYGLWYGRQELHNDRFIKKSLWISLSTFILIQCISNGLLYTLNSEIPEQVELLEAILGVNPMPPMPLYMLSGISIATFIISSCILVAKRVEQHPMILALNKTGQLALTFYVAHVLIGMGLVDILGTSALGSYSIQFSLSYALFFSILCILFANIWLRYKKSGPLEWLMRKIFE